MARKRRIDVKAPERSLLTDTLPYEIPIFFTNANLAILAMQDRLGKCSSTLHSRYLLGTKSSKPTRPMSFHINRPGQTPRRLSVAHPISQHLMCGLYAKHGYFIANACGRSTLSLRYPSRVATHYVDPRYVSASVASPGIGRVDEDPAGFRDQSRWASTFFSYREFNLSHKFFKSAEFLELERRYTRLLKLDIFRCFDSIYTHSIEWGMRGKEFAKAHLPAKNKVTFEAEFDAAVRHANWNETHGILVGPESSRIFAEIVLQSADRAILAGLGDAASDVAIRRYVDDYYVFSNSSEALDKVEDLIRRALLDLNLHLNAGKREVLSRPFVSRMSVAKDKIAAEIDLFFEKTGKVFDPGEQIIDTRTIEHARAALITGIRRASVETDTPYDGFASFGLTVLRRKLEEVSLERADKARLERGHVASLSWLIAVMRCAQFLYSTDHRATSSIKIAAIYSVLMRLSSDLGCARAPLERQILDGLRDVAMGGGNGGSDEITRINHISCVDLLLTEDRKVELADVERYLGPVSCPEGVKALSVFQLVCALFVFRRRIRFVPQKGIVLAEMERRVMERSFRPVTDCADALLLNEVIGCPHIDAESKASIIEAAYRSIMGRTCTTREARAIVDNSSWMTFVDWASTMDLAAMLARKELTPAYE